MRVSVVCYLFAALLAALCAPHLTFAQSGGFGSSYVPDGQGFVAVAFDSSTAFSTPSTFSRTTTAYSIKTNSNYYIQAVAWDQNGGYTYFFKLSTDGSWQSFNPGSIFYIYTYTSSSVDILLSQCAYGTSDPDTDSTCVIYDFTTAPTADGAGGPQAIPFVLPPSFSSPSLTWDTSSGSPVVANSGDNDPYLYLDSIAGVLYFSSPRLTYQEVMATSTDSINNVQRFQVHLTGVLAGVQETWTLTWCADGNQLHTGEGCLVQNFDINSAVDTTPDAVSSTGTTGASGVAGGYSSSGTDASYASSSSGSTSAVASSSSGAAPSGPLGFSDIQFDDSVQWSSTTFTRDNLGPYAINVFASTILAAVWRVDGEPTTDYFVAQLSGTSQVLYQGQLTTMALSQSSSFTISQCQSYTTDLSSSTCKTYSFTATYYGGSPTGHLGVLSVAGSTSSIQPTISGASIAVSMNNDPTSSYISVSLSGGNLLFKTATASWSMITSGSVQYNTAYNLPLTDATLASNPWKFMWCEARVTINSETAQNIPNDNPPSGCYIADLLITNTWTAGSTGSDASGSTGAAANVTDPYPGCYTFCNLQMVGYPSLKPVGQLLDSSTMQPVAFSTAITDYTINFPSSSEFEFIVTDRTGGSTFELQFDRYGNYAYGADEQYADTWKFRSYGGVTLVQPTYNFTLLWTTSASGIVIKNSFIIRVLYAAPNYEAAVISNGGSLHADTTVYPNGHLLFTNLLTVTSVTISVPVPIAPSSMSLFIASLGKQNFAVSNGIASLTLALPAGLKKGQLIYTGTLRVGGGSPESFKVYAGPSPFLRNVQVKSQLFPASVINSSPVFTIQKYVPIYSYNVTVDYSDATINLAFDWVRYDASDSMSYSIAGSGLTTSPSDFLSGPISVPSAPLAPYDPLLAYQQAGTANFYPGFGNGTLFVNIYHHSSIIGDHYYSLMIKRSLVQSVTLTSPQSGSISFLTPDVFMGSVTDYAMKVDATIRQVQITGSWVPYGAAMYISDVDANIPPRALTQDTASGLITLPDSNYVRIAFIYSDTLTSPTILTASQVYYFRLYRDTLPVDGFLEDVTVTNNQGKELVFPGSNTQFSTSVLTYNFVVDYGTVSVFLTPSFTLGSAKFAFAAVANSTISLFSDQTSPAIVVPLNSQVPTVVRLSYYSLSSKLTTYIFTFVQQSADVISFSSRAPAKLTFNSLGQLILDASNLGINSISAGDLDAYAVQASNLGYAGNWGVDLSGNNLKTLPVNLLPKTGKYTLGFLNLSSNALTAAALQRTVFNAAIYYWIDLSHNPLQSLPDGFVRMWASTVYSPSAVLRNTSLTINTINVNAFANTVAGLNSIDLSFNDLSGWNLPLNTFAKFAQPLLLRACSKNDLQCPAMECGFKCQNCGIKKIVNAYGFPTTIGGRPIGKPNFKPQCSYDFSNSATFTMWANDFSAANSLDGIVAMTATGSGTNVLPDTYLDLNFARTGVTATTLSSVLLAGRTFRTVSFRRNNIGVLPNTFAGMKARSLSLSNSSLTEIPAGSLTSAAFSTVDLSSNSLLQCEVGGVAKCSGLRDSGVRDNIDTLILSSTGITQIGTTKNGVRDWMPRMLSNVYLENLQLASFSMHNYSFVGANSNTVIAGNLLSNSTITGASTDLVQRTPGTQFPTYRCVKPCVTSFKNTVFPKGQFNLASVNLTNVVDLNLGFISINEIAAAPVLSMFNMQGGLDISGWDFNKNLLVFSGNVNGAVSFANCRFPSKKIAAKSPRQGESEASAAGRRLLQDTTLGPSSNDLITIPSGMFADFTFSSLDFTNTSLNYLGSSADKTFAGLKPVAGAKIILDGNDFSGSGVIGNDVFNQFSVDDDTSPQLSLISIQNCKLTYNSIDPQAFRSVNVLTLNLGNSPKAAAAAYNRFDPMPSIFGSAKTSPAITNFIIGDIVTMPDNLFGDFDVGGTAGKSIRFHFASGTSPATQLAKASAGYSPVTFPPTNTMDPNAPFSLTITGYNFASNSPKFNASKYVPAASATADDFRGYIMTPFSLTVPFDPEFLQPAFFTLFNAVKSLQFIAPQGWTDYASYQPGPVYTNTAIQVPWSPLLSKNVNASQVVPVNLLDSIVQLQSFTVAFPTRINWTVTTDGSQSPLPNGFFAGQARSGSLGDIDLSYAQISVFPPLLLSSMSWSISNLELNMNSLLTPAVPVPIGFFDDLLVTSSDVFPTGWDLVLSTVATSVYNSRQAYCFTSKGCGFCPASSYSSSFQGVSYCRYCLPGNYCPGKSMVKCPKGQFNPLSGQTACQLCPKGTYNSNLGSVQGYSCQSCPAGTSQEIQGADDISKCLACPAGRASFSQGWGLPCDLCAAGTYTNKVGSLTCTQCPRDTFSDSIGANSTATCQKCPDGRYAPVGSSSSDYCSLPSCPLGYMPPIGKTYPDCSQKCPAGYKCPGQLDVIPCNAGEWSLEGSYQCTPCPAGSFGSLPNTGPDACSPCPAGTYQSSERQAVCISCPANTFNDLLGSVRSTDCRACTKDSNGRFVCTTAASSPVLISALLDETGYTEASNDTSYGAAVPKRGGDSLRIRLFGENQFLVDSHATGNADATNGVPNPIFDPLAPQIPTSHFIAAAVTLACIAFVILVMYRKIPVTVVEYVDQLSLNHELATNEPVVNRPTQWGAAISGAWLCIAIAQAISIGTANNALLNSALVSPTVFAKANTAQGGMQVTLNLFGNQTDNRANWCRSGAPAFTSAEGFTTNWVELPRVAPAPQQCGIALDIYNTRSLGESNLTLIFPYYYQTVEWEAFTQGSAPGTWSRLLQYLVQLPQTDIHGNELPGMLDAQGELHFSLTDSYYKDDLKNQEYTGFELSFIGYETILAQDPNLVNSDSTIRLSFIFTKADILYSTQITQKTPIVDILSNILAAVVSLLSLFALFFTQSIPFLEKLRLPVGYLETNEEWMAELARKRNVTQIAPTSPHYKEKMAQAAAEDAAKKEKEDAEKAEKEKEKDKEEHKDQDTKAADSTEIAIEMVSSPTAASSAPIIPAAESSSAPVSPADNSEGVPSEGATTETPTVASSAAAESSAPAEAGQDAPIIKLHFDKPH